MLFGPVMRSLLFLLRLASLPLQPLSPVLPRTGSSPRLPHAASASSLVPQASSAGSLLPHQGSGISAPLLSHQSSGIPPTTPLARQGAGTPALPRQGSGLQLGASFPALQPQGSGIPHQGSGVPLLQRQGSPPPADWMAQGSPAAAASVSRRLAFGPPPPPAYARSVSAAEAGAAAAALAAEGGVAGDAGCSDEGSRGDGGSRAEGRGRGRRRRRRQPAPPAPLDQPSPAALLRVLAWVALLWVGYGFQRGLCAAGIPYDCDKATAADAFNTLTLLAFVGGAMGWLAGVARPARFAWLAAPRQLYLCLVYLAVLPAYSGISTIPALRVSLAGMGAWGPVPVVLKTLGALLLLAGSLLLPAGMHTAVRLHGPGLGAASGPCRAAPLLPMRRCRRARAGCASTCSSVRCPRQARAPSQNGRALLVQPHSRTLSPTMLQPSCSSSPRLPSMSGWPGEQAARLGMRQTAAAPPAPATAACLAKLLVQQQLQWQHLLLSLLAPGMATPAAACPATPPLRAPPPRALR